MYSYRSALPSSLGSSIDFGIGHLGLGDDMKDDATARRTVRLFRNGANQAVRIPREFEFTGDEVVLARDGDRLILEPVREGGLLDALRRSGGWDEPFPDVDDDLPPLDEVDL